MSSGNGSISLSFDGLLRDRVGQAEFALHADGKTDGVFTLTLNPGSGNRMLTGLYLTNSAGGIWDTLAPDGFWSLGVASDLDGPLLNTANDAVSSSFAEGSTLKIFAGDYENSMFLKGVSFTLTADFADGTTATVSTTIP